MKSMYTVDEPRYEVPYSSSNSVSKNIGRCIEEIKSLTHNIDENTKRLIIIDVDSYPERHEILVNLVNDLSYDGKVLIVEPSNIDINLKKLDINVENGCIELIEFSDMPKYINENKLSDRYVLIDGIDNPVYSVHRDVIESLKKSIDGIKTLILIGSPYNRLKHEFIDSYTDIHRVIVNSSEESFDIYFVHEDYRDIVEHDYSRKDILVIDNISKALMNLIDIVMSNRTTFIFINNNTMFEHVAYLHRLLLSYSGNSYVYREKAVWFSPSIYINEYIFEKLKLFRDSLSELLIDANLRNRYLVNQRLKNLSIHIDRDTLTKLHGIAKNGKAYFIYEPLSIARIIVEALYRGSRRAISRDVFDVRLDIFKALLPFMVVVPSDRVENAKQFLEGLSMCIAENLDSDNMFIDISISKLNPRINYLPVRLRLHNRKSYISIYMCYYLAVPHKKYLELVESNAKAIGYLALAHVISKGLDEAIDNMLRIYNENTFIGRLASKIYSRPSKHPI